MDFVEIAEDLQYPHIRDPPLLGDRRLASAYYVQDISGSDAVPPNPPPTPKPGNQDTKKIEDSKLTDRLQQAALWPVWAMQSKNWVPFGVAVLTVVMAPVVVPKVTVGAAGVAGYVAGSVSQYVLFNQNPHLIDNQKK